MPVISSIFFVIALTLAVVIGPQTRDWSWGPALLALTVAVVAGIPTCFKKRRNPVSPAIVTMAAVAVAWFAFRTRTSPDAEAALADLTLLAAAVGTFASVRAIAGHATAGRILIWGIALLLLANVIVIGKQVADPTFSPLFASRPTPFPTGFYAHYNHAACFLMVTSFLVAGSACFDRQPIAARIVLSAIAIAGLGAVFLTHSRGGILATAAGCGVFAGGALVVGKRTGARWFAPGLIAIPLIGLLVAGFLYAGWNSAQNIRQEGGGLDSLMDNNCRLYFLGIAMSCVAAHPIAGGGSRSFGWEVNRFWDNSFLGAGGARPEFVHNELVQSATDYGMVGLIFLGGLLAAIVFRTVLRLLFDKLPAGGETENPWPVGALAGFTGLAVQSCFSFLFHVLPGVMLLGICLSRMAGVSETKETALRRVVSRTLLAAAAIASLLILAPQGWSGVRITKIFWPRYFGHAAAFSPEREIDALGTAISIRPHSQFYLDRAAIRHRAFVESGGTATAAAESALSDYAKARRLAPFDPAPALNAANLLSALHRDDEAERAFAEALALQGGMEAGFRAHYYLALHLARKGARLFDRDSPGRALAALERAAEEMETAVKETPPWLIGLAGRNERINLHESLGIAREVAGDETAALEAYDFASAIHQGEGVQCRAGLLYRKMGESAFAARDPGKAMGFYIEARRRFILSGNQPRGATPEIKKANLDWLDKMIAFLKGAKVEPVPASGK